MVKLQTEVLVIGGGATGSGILRDLALRGFKAVLVDKGDLTHGTSGRYHGLLHSGGRYAVKDPHAAAECIQENRILRRIMPHCIEDTGGFFVLTPFDDPGYVEPFLAGCRQAGIPVEEISPAEALKEEPLLNPHILRCFRLPDGAADSFAAAGANTACAQEHGALTLPYHQVSGLLMDQGRVCGARLLDLAAGEEFEIGAELVINAAGAWAGQIAAFAGAQVTIIPGKGTMIAANHRLVHTVINRCKMPSDGDILVPAHTVAVIGTTDVRVSDPDHYAIEDWEIRLLLEEGEKLVPGFKGMRMLRAWAGVRPLYQESQVGSTRDVTRAFVLLDHQERDGVDGLVTITSGKWTTYRKMAEAAVDLVCQKLGVQRECRTHLEALPEAAQHGFHRLGKRLAETEKNHAFGELVCECELVSAADVSRSIVQDGAQTLDDIRRDTRLGMGPCQGGFCSYRAAGMLQQLRNPPVEQTNQALKDFLQERWKGLLPVLWGQQLRQQRLDELIYYAILAVDRLTGMLKPGFASTPYLPPQAGEDAESDAKALLRSAQMGAHPALAQQLPPNPRSKDVLVCGMGLAGLAAAWKAGQNGARVRLVAKGGGSLHFQPGCLDLIGVSPTESGELVLNPAAALEQLIHDQPDHPYARAGVERIRQSLDAFQALCQEQEYPMMGTIEKNWLLPTAVGASRPTCLAPESMIAGDLRRREPVLVIGFEKHQDFYPNWIAANLEKLGIPAQSLRLTIPSLAGRSFITSRVLAECFDQPDFAGEVVEQIQKTWRSKPGFSSARIAFPAVLGLRNHRRVFAELRHSMGAEIFEIPTLPPSIPGMRLHNLLKAAVTTQGGQVFDAMQISGFRHGTDQTIAAVVSEAAAGEATHYAQKFILASGGFLGGGFSATVEGELHETIFAIPVEAPNQRSRWLQRQFLAEQAHPIFTCGLRVDPAWQPCDAHGKPVFANLFAAGSVLAGGDFLRQRALDGVAWVSGYLAAEQAWFGGPGGRRPGAAA